MDGLRSYQEDPWRTGAKRNFRILPPINLLPLSLPSFPLRLSLYSLSELIVVFLRRPIRRMLRPDHDHPARLQLQKKAAAAWKGIVPGLHRQCIYGGLYYCCSGPCFVGVKSRMMCDSAYKSTVDCFVQTLKNDGPLAFYEGFLPNFARLGSWNVIMFLTLEQLYSPKGVCEEAWELEE